MTSGHGCRRTSHGSLKEKGVRDETFKAKTKNPSGSGKNHLDEAFKRDRQQRIEPGSRFWLFEICRYNGSSTKLERPPLNE